MLMNILLINREIRNHDNAKKEWTDDELKKLYETHERLLDLVSLFCYVPRVKYLPLGPIRYYFTQTHQYPFLYFCFFWVGLTNYFCLI